MKNGVNLGWIRLLLRLIVYWYLSMNREVMSAIKRQIPFLIGGTITGIIMSYFLGFAVTIIVNSITWYLISLVVFKLVWKNNGLTDQIVILKYALSRTKRQKNIQRTRQ
jgi:hypothetical protein